MPPSLPTPHSQTARSAPSAAGRRFNTLWLWLPKLAMGGILFLVLGFLWLYQGLEEDEQRQTLIADILWLEQNIRFQLQDNAEHLTVLGSDLVTESDRESAFRVRAEHLLRTRPEFVQVNWLNASGKRLFAHPRLPTRADELAAFGPAPSNLAEELSRQLGKPAYTAPYRVVDGEGRVDVWVPIFDGGGFSGSLVATYSLETLLSRQVPWWFAEKYFVQIVDDNGTPWARKSNVTGSPASVYSLALDPPGQGLLLQAVAYRSSSGSALRVLAASIIVLALIVLWSLWALRGHIRRRQNVELALRQAHAFREAMENSLLTGLRARDLSGRITYVNPAFCRMTGFSAAELVGRLPPMPYWAEEEMDATLAMHQAVLQGEAPSEGHEIRLKRKTGERFDALIYEAPLIDGNGEHVGWMGSVMDITDRNRSRELMDRQQEQLQHTGRLIALGEMASTLAHELNQPLAAISSYASGASSLVASPDGSSPEALAGALEKIRQQAQRAGRIIRQVHDFAKKREPRLEPCSMAEIVDDAVALFEPNARKSRVRIQRSIQAGLPDVMADPTMIEQVLINLFRNATDAMVETEETRRIIRIELGQKDHTIEVRVIDHGGGIPPELADNLFTPFFSSKSEGLGMGLAICRSIIEFHRGRLSVTHQMEGAGACFSFFLPIPTR